MSVFTDSLGRFRIDSLNPGTYQVGVFHPLLDTLGLSLATQPFHVGPDSVSIVRLSVPSPATIIARTCTARPRSQGNSAVIGQVIDPETMQPIKGADVSIAWTEFEVSKEKAEEIRERAQGGAKVLEWFETVITDRDGDVVAKVRREVYIREKKRVTASRG